MQRGTDKISEPSSGKGVEPACPVVGIGASAGGVAALQKFFPHVPADSGLAYVVIQHLDAERESVLASIIERCAHIEAQVATDDGAIEPNRIYVIPPGVSMTIRDCRLHLKSLPEAHGRPTSVDEFLASLAEDQGENAAAVILSGTGSDGALGLRAIKEHGGFTLAQESAEYDGMMSSAVRTGLVDVVIPAEKMPAKLIDYFRHISDVEQKKGRGGIQRGVAAELPRIAALLRTRTGHDFSGYKDNTIVRRIQRRMQVLQTSDAAAFYERLRDEPGEVDLLFRDLLIGVTNFFRDREAFEVLEKLVIPKLFEGKGPGDIVRVWVPGCSTGEEAYSIAMLLREQAARMTDPPGMQIFATDIDDNALEIARTGRYPVSIADDVPAARLREFFTREDGTYRIAPGLRELCLFSSHNLLRNPPFSRLDLLTCRNLLIYMNPELQERIIPLFHYALRDGGYLFLGSSENVTRHTRLFSTVEKTSRIFQKRRGAETRLPDFPLAAIPPSTDSRSGRPPSPQAASNLKEKAERLLLGRYSPAYVVVNAQGELLHTSGGTGKYLEFAAGTPDHNVFSMSRPGLRMDLRAALHRAVSTGHVTVQDDVGVGTEGGRQKVSLVVQPLPAEEAADPLYMLIFRDVGPVVSDMGPDVATIEDVESATIHQLETELRETKERLQITMEELESSNEELKSSNEELSSINEELQSSNEELETSKEELQSINEELHAVNAELNMRVDELSRANNDIANLLESTQIATVFLDRDFCIKNFTPAARDLFHLVESDIGRPLAHVRPRFDADALQEDIAQVVRRLGSVERKVQSNESDARYLMRIFPYRTLSDVIAGAVVTFVDVTEIALAEERIGVLSQNLRNRVESLETLLDLVPVGIFISENENESTLRANRSAAKLIGATPAESKLTPVPSKLPLMKDDREIAPSAQPVAQAMATSRPVAEYEACVVRPDGASSDVLVSANPLFNEAGKVRGAIGAMVDITMHKEAERAQERLLHELQHRVKNILATVTALTSRMIRSSATIEDFSKPFLERLQAMARTHELLSQQSWAGADLKSLIAAAILPYTTAHGENVVLSGPAIQLKPNAAGTCGIVFFELANNAAKYGAFTADKGRVFVEWQVDAPRGVLQINWREVGGPPVKPPERRNFGTTFIAQSLEYELGGKAALRFEKTGLQCVLEVPLSLTA